MNNNPARHTAPQQARLWDGPQQKELLLVKTHSNWPTPPGKEIGRISFVEKPCIYVDSVGFSPDGTFILAASRNVCGKGEDVLILAEAPN